MDALSSFGGFAEGFFNSVGNLFERGFEAAGCEQCFSSCGAGCNNVCCFDVQSVLFEPLQNLCAPCCNESAFAGLCNGCGRCFIGFGNAVADIANHGCGICSCDLGDIFGGFDDCL